MTYRKLQLVIGCNRVTHWPYTLSLKKAQCVDSRLAVNASRADIQTWPVFKTLPLFETLLNSISDTVSIKE